MIARLVAALAVLAALAAPATADTSKADALFKKGKKLLADGKYAEACAAFEASQRAEPTIGTLLNVARCYEEWGKLATAYDDYAEALRQAEAAQDDRTDRIRERLAAIDPTVPTLVIRADTRPVDLVVQLDGKPLANGELDVPRRLDPGEHLIEYGIGDGPHKRLTVALEASSHQTVVLDNLADMQAGGPVEEELDKPEEEPPPPPPPPGHPGRTRRILAAALAGAGLVAVGASSWLVLDARADYRAAVEAHCNGMHQCDAVGLDRTHDARRRANIGTVVWSVGAAALAGGVVLWLTAPRARAVERASGPRAVQVIPVVGADGGGLAVVGGF